MERDRRVRRALTAPPLAARNVLVFIVVPVVIEPVLGVPQPLGKAYLLACHLCGIVGTLEEGGHPCDQDRAHGLVVTPASARGEGSKQGQKRRGLDFSPTTTHQTKLPVLVLVSFGHSPPTSREKVPSARRFGHCKM